MVQKLIIACASIGVIVSIANGTPAAGQALIDSELEHQIDLRAPEYGACIGLAECTVDGVTFIAERRSIAESDTGEVLPADETTLWLPAELYWDPIDGFGILDGAQNDEIDFDERLRMTFESPVRIDGVWFSDLFKNEDRRYGSSDTDRIEGVDPDSEVAAIGLYIGDTEFQQLTVAADDRLPWASFNQEISVKFSENGDMRRRVVINGELISLVVPGQRNGRAITLNMPLGQIGADKKAIFEGVETVEVDLTDILANFQGAPLFAAGSSNFEIIKAIAESPDALQQIREVAERKRETIRMSNGEVAWRSETPVEVDGLSFFAPFDASNDFSVAGIILNQILLSEAE